MDSSCQSNSQYNLQSRKPHQWNHLFLHRTCGELAWSLSAESSLRSRHDWRGELQWIENSLTISCLFCHILCCVESKTICYVETMDVKLSWGRDEEWGRSFLLLLVLLQRRKNKGLAFLLRNFPIFLCRGTTKEIEKFSHSIRAKRKIYWQTNEFSQIEISVILCRDECVLSSYPRHIVLWAAAVDVKFSHEKIEWLWDNSCALKITVILLNWIINYNNFPRRRDSMKKNMLHPRSLKQRGIISSSPVLSVAHKGLRALWEKEKKERKLSHCVIFDWWERWLRYSQQKTFHYSSFHPTNRWKIIW